MEQPLVSICCITYNHEHYIKEAFDGFIMQKTNFPVEIVISDDCSKDNTREIIAEYKAKYPDLIRDVSPDKNLGSSANFIYVQQCAQGKYIAICEGDDYWTDPYKLQKQVDFLEAHSEYSVCWHRYKRWNMISDVCSDDDNYKIIKNGAVGTDIDINTYFSHWYTQPLTMVYRRDSLDLDWCEKFKYFRDMHMMYNLLRHGNGYVFSFCGGIYRMHLGGVASMKSKKQYCDISMPMDREFFWKTLEEGPRINYLATLDTCVKVYAKNEKCKALWCAIVRFALSLKIHNFWNNLKIVLSKE